MIRRAAFLVAAIALSLSTPALAQTGQAQTADPAPASQSRFSEQEMRAFANATIDLQSLGSNDVGAQTHVIEAAGMSVEQYNRMGDAMRNEPSLAGGLQPYLDSARAERAGHAGAYSYMPPSSGVPAYSPPWRSGGSGYHASRHTTYRSGRAATRTTTKTVKVCKHGRHCKLVKKTVTSKASSGRATKGHAVTGSHAARGRHHGRTTTTVTKTRAGRHHVTKTTTRVTHHGKGKVVVHKKTTTTTHKPKRHHTAE